MSDRAAVFIDAGYLERILEQEHDGALIDYRKLGVALCPAGVGLLRAYYYNCPPFQGSPPTEEERRRTQGADRFYHALRRLPGFEVRLGKLGKGRCPQCGMLALRQKRTDIMLCVDLLRLASGGRISDAVLVAGDSDFLPAVQVAKDEGVVLHLWHGGRADPPHQELYEVCDQRHAIDAQFVRSVLR